MSQPTVPFNLKKANPGIIDLLTVMKDVTSSSINCVAVGTVQEYYQASNPKLYAVKATINYSKTYFVQQADGTYQTQQQPYPEPLVDCPAIRIGGGTTGFSLPITKGDPCLILFNDRDLSNWFAGAQSGPVASSRLHSLADGIALVGFSTVPQSSTHALVTNGDAEIGVPLTGGLNRIANQALTLGGVLMTLTAALTALGTALAAATSTTGDLGLQGALNTAGAALDTAIAAVNVEIGDLLE